MRLRMVFHVSGHRTIEFYATGRPREAYAEVVDDGKLQFIEWRRIMCRVGKKAAGRELDGRTWDEYPVRYE